MPGKQPPNPFAGNDTRGYFAVFLPEDLAGYLALQKVLRRSSYQKILQGLVQAMEDEEPLEHVLYQMIEQARIEWSRRISKTAPRPIPNLNDLIETYLQEIEGKLQQKKVPDVYITEIITRLGETIEAEEEELNSGSAPE